MTTLKRVVIENGNNAAYIREIENLAEEVLEYVQENNDSIEESWYENGEVFFTFTQKSRDVEDFDLLAQSAKEAFDENFDLRGRTEYPNWF